VPADHPAMSAMLMNITSNMLGLGNAATPFGIKAMMELDRLNGSRGTASDAMIVFLAINTSGFALLPSTVISMRVSAGSHDPAGIFATTWFASGCAAVTGVLAALLLARLPYYRRTSPASREAGPQEQGEPPSGTVATESGPVAGRWRGMLGMGFALALVIALVVHVARALASSSPADLVREILSYWILPVLVGAIVLFGWVRGAKVYASLVEGAKEGFDVAIKIIPYLVAILVMVGMFRASGGLDLLVRFLDPLTGRIGLPAEALPVALLRPLSGSGAFAVMADILSVHGPDSFLGYMVSTIQGSTETTFYVLAVYFGAVGVRTTRHALPACLMADLAGICAAVFIVNVVFG
jgi:spore maturation protein SpmB